jgi:hypothetical protein
VAELTTKGYRAVKKRKPRIPTLGLDFGPVDATITGMQQNEDGSVTLFGTDGEPLFVPAGNTSLGYPRSKGQKITVQIPHQGYSVGSVQSALARFSRIVCVDTNSREHDGEKVCVTVVCELSDVRYEGLRWFGHCDPLWALEFRQPLKDSERIGWRHALARGEELGWLMNNPNLLLVVDSHLDELYQINQRRTPLIDDFMLPLGVSIAYASADAASDSVLNGAIARCDAIARQVLSHAIAPSSLALSPLHQSHGTIFRAYRYWTFAN